MTVVSVVCRHDGRVRNINRFYFSYLIIFLCSFTTRSSIDHCSLFQLGLKPTWGPIFETS